VLGSGCSVLGIDNGTEAELKDERRAWNAQNLRNYTYEFGRFCFCGEVRPVVITVQNDEVTRVVFKENGEPATQFLENYRTITDLYDYLIVAAVRADEMDVAFDDARHPPVLVDIDFIKNAIDDELRLTLANFTVTAP
jgi:hypothetical protein